MSSSSLTRIAPWVVVAVALVVIYFVTHPSTPAPGPPTASAVVSASSATAPSSASPTTPKASASAASSVFVPPASASVKVPLPPDPAGLNVGTFTAKGFGDVPLLAKSRSFFEDEHLTVNLARIGSASDVVTGLAKGTLDAGVTFDFTIAFVAFEQTDFAVVAKIAEAKWPLTIYARKDRGIVKPRDLKGKKIGVDPAPSSHYFWSLFAKRHKLAVDDATLVPMNRQTLAAAMKRGDVDAIADAFTAMRPADSNLLKTPDLETVDLSEPGLCPVQLALAMSPTLVREKSAAAEGITRAIGRAVALMKDHPDDGSRAIAQELGLVAAQVQAQNAQLTYAMAGPSSLVDGMKQAGAWFIASGRDKEGKGQPDYTKLTVSDPYRRAQTTSAKPAP